jgi:glycosyltransferase involved in cell wall biosynthesis
LPRLSRRISPLGDLQSLVHLVRLIRRERPRILHTHPAKAGALGRVAALLAGRARPPVIVHTFHGHVLRGYFSPAVERAFRLVETALARVSTRLVTVSEQVRDELVELGVAPREKFVVVPLGIDLADRVLRHEGARDEVRARLGLGPETFVVGWAGRMTAIKRVGDLVAAFDALHARGVDAALVLVGDGPDRPPPRDGIVVTGYVDDVGPYYWAFDAFLMASANEGTPVVAIEALAAGRPVVGTRVGGMAHVVRDGESGFLVEAGDVDGLAGALERLARDPELRARMGAAGRDVVDRFSVDRLVADVDALYRELLATSG